MRLRDKDTDHTIAARARTLSRVASSETSLIRDFAIAMYSFEVGCSLEHREFGVGRPRLSAQSPRPAGLGSGA
jgi:hypothetical protein